MVQNETGLQPLEFADCILDSPAFRVNLCKHEKELEKTSQQIKRIIKEIKDLMTAARELSKAQLTLSKSLDEFNFGCIGSTQTDDENVIVNSLKQFSKLIATIEEERDNMLGRSYDHIVLPLEDFRKKHINGVKENKKKFDKKTGKFCQAQEKFLSMSSKKPDNTIQEADASLGMLEREYLHESLSYVLKIQEVQERIKFEFVEILLKFMKDWLTFYHCGYEIHEEAKDYMVDLQLKVQKTRENFHETRTKAEELKTKFMDSKMKTDATEYTKQGYLFLMEKKAFTAMWNKYYCTYKKKDKAFSMIQYNQIQGRTESNSDESFTLESCIRRASEFEKRYCFDLMFEQKPNVTFTFQALSDEDRKAWLNAMDGKEPTCQSSLGTQPINDDFQLDDVGFAFVRKCIEVLENRGLEEEGLYRVGGVNTKISKLLSLGVDRKKVEKERLQYFHDDSYSDLMESKTIASALKQFLRHLNEPLMTYRYHNGFIAAAKQDSVMQRISDVHTLVYRLPKQNFDMLELVVRHLKAVSMKSNKNKMSVFNLGVVFGPTLLRPLEDTIASILDIKFNNVVIEILIDNYEIIFRQTPGNVKLNDYMDYTISEHRGDQMMGGSTYSMSSGGIGSSSSAGLYRRSKNNAQPVMRVVAKSKHTDPVMSSSLHSIPNGLSSGSGGSIHTGSSVSPQNKNNHYQTIYDAKLPSNNMNQSTPALHLSPRDLASIGRAPGGGTGNGGLNGGEPTYITTSTSSIHSSGPNSYHSPRTNDRNAGGTVGKLNRTALGTDGIYGATRLHHPPGINYNDTSLGSSNHLTDRADAISINDRINSTSSSNESVCSSSSRDLISTTSSPYNHLHHTSTAVVQSSHLQHHNNRSYHSSPPPPAIPPAPPQSALVTATATKINFNSKNNSYTIRDGSSTLLNETSQKLLPKKIQRGKPVDKSKFHPGRENVRVRTLYACLAENDGELSFEPNQIITNVRPSNEPGWLEGTLAGKSGLIPENYVEVLP